MTTITCFDGVNCIGGNKILLEDGESRLFFDFGTNFGAAGAYYDEFMQPKTVTGLFEHIRMGFLPPFRDLYRPDLECGACDMWADLYPRDIGEVSGVLVSHAHVDHIGALGFLRTDIPIYSSTVSAAISRALQDTAASGAQGEYCYYVERTPDGAGLLSSPNYRSCPYTGRRYRLTEPEISEEFIAYWSSCASSRDLMPADLEHATDCAGMEVRSFPVDHSVYGATAWAVKTSEGWVVYSGDLRVHGRYGDYTRRFAEAAAKLEPIALIIEGTRIDKQDTYTEMQVKQSALDAVRQCRGLVVADFGPRNVERLLSFLEIARETGRTLAILPKDAYLLDAMRAAGGAQEVPDLNSAPIAIYWEYSAAQFKWQGQVCGKYPALEVGPRDVTANQDKFICCFSYWDINELAYIHPVPGSIYIYSSCEPFSEEMAIDTKKLKEWVRCFDLKLFGAITDTVEESDDPFHVSGHASGPDLYEIVRTIKPKKLIPIHTLHPELYIQNVGDVCEITYPERGAPIVL